MTNRSCVIAVTGPRKRFKFGWWATKPALFFRGLGSVYLSPGGRDYRGHVDGIIIGGGDDIEPEHYGETGDAGAHYDPERDRLEMEMAERAIDAKIPIMGICRGAQLLNVVLGGTLHTDLRPMRKSTPNRNTAFPVKWVDLNDGSALREITNQQRLKVNSLHSQAVDQVGRGLKATAFDADGFIQATEGVGFDSFVLGVQWHPEYLPYSRHQRSLFREFCDAVTTSRHRLQLSD